MKLYVVLYDNGYDERNFDSVFRTKELAEERSKELNRSCKEAWWDEVELDPTNLPSLA